MDWEEIARENGWASKEDLVRITKDAWGDGYNEGYQDGYSSGEAWGHYEWMAIESDLD